MTGTRFAASGKTAGDAPRPAPAARRIEILVISLEGAEARRRLMHAQLDLPGMPPHRILDAVDGRRLDAAQLAALHDPAAARRHAGRALTRPEIGCALSHLAAYRHIAEQGLQVALVLEDDALLGRQFLGLLDRLVPLMDPAQPQAILLSHVERFSGWGPRRVDKIHCLYRPYLAYGAHAYLITLAGARAMLSALQPVRTVADDWRYFMKAGVLQVSALIPYAVGTAPLADASQIGDERFAEPARRGMRRWVRKYLWQKFLFQLFVKPVMRLRRHESTW